jgi:hypothetical protein
MLCLAGGICHFFIDMIGHRGFNLYLTQWDDTSLHDIQAWGNAYYHNFGVISILSFVMILIVILLLFQVLQQESKSQYLFILGVMAAIVLITLLIDGQIFAELEMTMVVVIGLYFLFPLTLLYKALSEVFEYNQKQLKEPSERSPRKLNSDQIFKLIVVFLGLLVFALIIAGIVVLGMAEEISTRFGYAEELFTLGSIAVIVLAIFLGITTVLLALKKEFARKIIIGICFMAFITIITMVIAFALCEKDIKEQFH